jgi:L-fuconolactonase
MYQFYSRRPRGYARHGERGGRALPDFPIVDAHVHIYDTEKLSFPWMAGIPHLNRPHGPKDFTERTSGVAVDKMVFVEVDVAPGQYLDEARWVAEAARQDPRIQAIVASIPLEKGEGAEADIAALAKMPLARGVRRLIQPHVAEPGWCLRPDFVKGVKLLPKYGLSFDICILHPQMGDAIELVRRCPEVSFILDHIGKPGIKAGIRDPWWGQIKALAELPNVACKISGVVTEADHKTWTYDQVAPYIERVIECFGFDRVMFGGDWPVCELATGYENWVSTLDRVLSKVPRSDLEKLYRDNAIRAYRLEPQG